MEERFQWVSLCVTELKSNVAAYMDNLEVSAPHSPKARPTSYPGTRCRDAGMGCEPGVLTNTLQSVATKLGARGSSSSH